MPLKPTYTIAVRTLVDHLMRHGDLRTDFVSSVRGVEGIRAHQRIQKQRPSPYQAEVAVQYDVKEDEFDLRLNGRIDGVMVADGKAVIEEIKTTRISLQTLEPNPIHWGQLKCYAYMWACEHGWEEVHLHLTYVHLGGGGVETLEQVYDLETLSQFFNGLMEKYLHWIRSLTQWGTIRDRSIHQLDFPFNHYRAGQREMAKAVYRTIRDQGHLLVQAATGIGKTMAALFPAIKALAERRMPKVVFLTARTTGRVAAETALQTLRSGGMRLRSVTVTAKDKICFFPDSTCVPEECPCAKGHFDRINDALLDAFTSEHLTREAISSTAQIHQVCPFELTLELVGWADCVIGDYNYAFAPGVVLQRLFGEDAEQHAVLVDEAHNLVDRSRDMFSATLTKDTVLRLRRSLKERLPSLYRSLGRINAWMVTTRRRCRQLPDGVEVDKALPIVLMEKLQDFLWGAEKWLMRNEPADFRQALLEFYFECMRFQRVAEGYDHRYVTTYECMGDELRVKLFCVDPSHLLQQAWKNCHAAVLFSATLTPATYFQDILGCHPETQRVNLPSPFPRENFAVFVAHKVSTYYKQRKQSCLAVSRSLEALVRHRTGHYLLFFPSYAYMEMVHQQFASDCGDIQTMVQTPEMSETEREFFLDQFRSEGKITLAGFAVMGGIFGEGIDLRGEQLTGAAIVGVGLPGICQERDVIRDYYDSNGGSGFEFAYQYPGINRVLQAAGRVIRSETDQGVVLLIDSRYGRDPYRSFFPKHWRASHVGDARGFVQQLSDFWKKEDQPG